MREKLIALSMVKKGDWNEMYNVLRQDAELSSIDEVFAHQFIETLQCDVLTIMDEDYPEVLKDMSKPPFVVYLKGDKTLLNECKLTVVGGKNTSLYTKKEIDKVLRKLPNEIVVATGLERGAELQFAKSLNKQIIGIANGFNNKVMETKAAVYEKLTNKDLILSEIPPNCSFNMQSYYRMYQILAELSTVILVFQLPLFDLRVKYLNHLTQIGKNVFVLPDQIDKNTSGGLRLVNFGAKNLLDLEEVISQL